MFFPISDSPNPKGIPWATWTIIAINILIFVVVNLPLSTQPADNKDPAYQEYVQFLSLANDGSDSLLGSTGQDLLDAWLNTGMAAPHVMAETTWSDPTSPWTNLGHGKSGAYGEPALLGTGAITLGGTIDLSGSAVVIEDNDIVEFGDKGVSVGERARAAIRHNRIVSGRRYFCRNCRGLLVSTGAETGPG